MEADCGRVQKKLSRGRFRWPRPRAGEVKVVLSHEELAMLLGWTEARRIRGIASQKPQLSGSGLDADLPRGLQ
jgi:transposase